LIHLVLVRIAFTKSFLVYEFPLLNTKEDILKNACNQTVVIDIAIDFQSMEEKKIKQWGPSTVWLPTFFKISSFEIHTGLEQHEDE